MAVGQHIFDKCCNLFTKKEEMEENDGHEYDDDYVDRDAI